MFQGCSKKLKEKIEKKYNIPKPNEHDLLRGLIY